MNNVCFLWIYALAAVLACSCASSEWGKNAVWHGDAKGHIAFSSFDFVRTAALSNDMGKKSPSLKCHLHLLDIERGDLQTLLNKTLYDGMDCRQYALWRFETVRHKYFNAKPDNETLARDSHFFDWEDSETCSGWLYRSVMVLERERYMYDGGAHGIEEIEYFVLDTAKDRHIRLNDLIVSGSMAALSSHVESALKKEYAARNSMKIRPDTTLSSLGFFEDKAPLPADNFYITPESLCFVWNPYTIAPYSFGCIRAVIPLNDISKLLTDYGRALFAAMAQ